ncbi:MAG: 3-deoxy-7-phosphoheptulonate synthase, partial [Ktedonobacteraceae bacterium]
MIVIIRSSATGAQRAQLLALVNRITGSQRPVTSVKIDGREVVVCESSSLDAQSLPLLRQQEAVERVVPITTTYKLVSRAFKAQTSSIVVGGGTTAEPVIIGGADSLPVMIAGPCAVESREQLLTIAHAVKAAGARMLRGGAFKPRTSPYQFQGLGIHGLQLLAEARAETGLPVITEVMEPDLVETVAQYADVLQIGSRNMQNFPLLLAAGRNSYKRPVMLKRGLSATID